MWIYIKIIIKMQPLIRNLQQSNDFFKDIKALYRFKINKIK